METQRPKGYAAIVVLLVLILGILAFNTVESELDRQAAAQARVDRTEAVASAIQQQNELVRNLLDNYQAAAYENSGIDRITEQQLIAEEYQLTALQVLALQNMQILQMLAEK